MTELRASLELDISKVTAGVERVEAEIYAAAAESDRRTEVARQRVRRISDDLRAQEAIVNRVEGRLREMARDFGRRATAGFLTGLAADALGDDGFAGVIGRFGSNAAFGFAAGGLAGVGLAGVSTMVNELIATAKRQANQIEELAKRDREKREEIKALYDQISAERDRREQDLIRFWDSAKVDVELRTRELIHEFGRLVQN